MRVGMGYDVHKLVEGRRLILGGVEIPYEKGLLGHSDADVLVHAIMDALLGAAALGDIGKHFPDTDPAYEGADSMRLLEEVRKLLDANNYVIGNVDATVIAQRPKLAPYIDAMRRTLRHGCRLIKIRLMSRRQQRKVLDLPGRDRESVPRRSACLRQSIILIIEARVW